MDSLRAPSEPAPYGTSPQVPVSVWFTQPLGLYSRITADYVMDRHGASFIMDCYRQGMLQLGPQADDAKLIVVHDWTRLTRMETKTKAELVSWAIEIRDHMTSIDFILADDASVFIKMAASVTESTFATLGLPVRSHFGKSSAEVLKSLGVRLTSGPLGSASGQ